MVRGMVVAGEVTVVLWWAALAWAGAPGSLLGTWEHAGGATDEAAVAAVVDEGAGRFNFAFRPIARQGIQKAAAIDTRIAITGDEQAVRIVFSGPNERESGGPADGTPVTLRGAEVTYVVSDGRMVVRGVGSQGGKQSTYVVDGETMRVTHELFAEQLGDPPLTWTVTYRRAP